MKALVGAFNQEKAQALPVFFLKLREGSFPALSATCRIKLSLDVSRELRPGAICYHYVNIMEQNWESGHFIILIDTLILTEDSKWCRTGEQLSGNILFYSMFNGKC